MLQTESGQNGVYFMFKRIVVYLSIMVRNLITELKRHVGTEKMTSVYFYFISKKRV